MNAAAPHPRPTRRARGFSLIEVMVVLVIIGIATAAVGLSVRPDSARVLRQDARALAQRLQAAQQSVRADGRLIAWQADEHGYRFSRGTWQQVPGSVVPQVSTAGALDHFERDDTLRPRPWGVEGVHATPAGPVVLTADWIGPPWQIVLSNGQASVTLRREADGRYGVE